MSSFVGAIAVADLVKTTLGPQGMDKILQSVRLENIIAFWNYTYLCWLDKAWRVRDKNSLSIFPTHGNTHFLSDILSHTHNLSYTHTLFHIHTVSHTHFLTNTHPKSLSPSLSFRSLTPTTCVSQSLTMVLLFLKVYLWTTQPPR